MRVISCLHPHTVRNPYTGEIFSARCGKCDACRNQLAAVWVQKLDQEMQCHRYTLFVTLQYNDLDIPQYVRLRKEDTPFISGQYDWSYIDSETGQLLSFSDSSITRHRKSDREYIFDTKVLNVLSKRDAQLFIKLLRYHARKLTNSYRNIRYFLTGEYGGKTFRPHLHVLLFFDSEDILKNIESLLLSSWKHGNIYDPHLVNGSASEYVASYVNSFAKLPSIYEHRAIRQFSLFSKSPAIGTLQILQQDIKEMFFGKLDKIRLYSPNKNRFLDVPTWRSLQDRCFPRIPRFSWLSHHDRVTLYSFGRRFSESTAGACAEWIKRYFVTPAENVRRPAVNRGATDGKNIKLESPVYHQYDNFYGHSFLNNYFYEITHVTKYDKLHRCFYQATTKNTLLHFVYVVRRACASADAFGLTLDEYIKNIDEFYEKCEVSHLKDYYVFQDEYFKLHPEEKHGLYFDVAFCQRVNGKLLKECTLSDQYYLKVNMICDDSDDVVHLDYTDCFDYRDMQSLHEIITHSNTKTKLMNDYVYQHSDEFQNILKYYENLEDI